MERPEQQREGVDIELLKRKRDEIFEDSEKYEEFIKFVKKLKAKYKDYEDYLLYHKIVAGSTAFDDHEFSKVDFPGDYSIEKFINSLQGN